MSDRPEAEPHHHGTVDPLERGDLVADQRIGPGMVKKRPQEAATQVDMLEAEAERAGAVRGAVVVHPAPAADVGHRNPLDRGSQGSQGRPGAEPAHHGDAAGQQSEGAPVGPRGLDRRCSLTFDQVDLKAGGGESTAEQEAGVTAAHDEDARRIVARAWPLLGAGPARRPGRSGGNGGEQVDLDRVVDTPHECQLQLLQRAMLDLPDPLLADPQPHTELLERAAVLAQACARG